MPRSDSRFHNRDRELAFKKCRELLVEFFATPSTPDTIKNPFGNRAPTFRVSVAWAIQYYICCQIDEPDLNLERVKLFWYSYTIVDHENGIDLSVKERARESQIAKRWISVQAVPFRPDSHTPVSQSASVSAQSTGRLDAYSFHGRVASIKWSSPEIVRCLCTLLENEVIVGQRFDLVGIPDSSIIADFPDLSFIQNPDDPSVLWVM